MITKEYLQQELAKRIDGYKRGVETSTDNIISEMKSILVLVDALPDHEKKYNEALERASHIKDNNTVATPQEVAEHIFPELRESEDEKIRKRAIAILKQQRDYWSYDGPMDKCPPLTMRQDLVDAVNAALSYLEKQKEQNPNYCHHEVDETGWTEEYRKAYYDGWNNCNMQHEQLKTDHKPAEWSEEDEEMAMKIDCYLSSAIGVPEDERQSIDNWLKSIRPKSQGVYKTAIESIFKMCESYEKKGIFTDERAIDFLGNVRVKCKDAIECAPVLDESSWKPSEEQMKALETTAHLANFGCDIGRRNTLLSLCNDLKKL